jgi:hypothetical protein
MFAPSNERFPKMLSGTSGALLRISIAIETRKSTPDAISSKIVRVDPQPTSGAFDTA